MLFLCLVAIFVASLVACNLIFQKFFYWHPLSWLGQGNTGYAFEISVGILPYPITFLVTDLISELFGRRRANQVVIAGIVAAIFTFLVVTVAQAVPATSWSPVNDDTFSQVFGLTGVAVGSSMLAYLLAQFIDVRLYHFWKQLTKGKHLWLRNNFSTITSQFVDTATVLLLLCAVGTIKWSLFPALLLGGFIFKVLVALIDTPLIYLLVWWTRRRFALQEGEEISLD